MRVLAAVLLTAGTLLRTNDLQVWFLSEHLVDVPLIKGSSPSLEDA